MGEDIVESPRSNVLHGKYELGRLIGRGSFAKVCHARNVMTGESVAIKILSKETVIKAGMMEQLMREISIMKQMNHPNIVKLHEVMATKTKIYLAMEYVRGGELFDKVYKGRLEEDMARSYFQQLILAIDCCHRHGVCHRDLKPENLLIDEEGTLKITDFGLSALSDHLQQDGLLHTACGTPAYVAPEVIVKKGYEGSKADLWSCGVILFVMLAGYLPFQHENVLNLYAKIRRGEFKCPPWFSNDSRRILTGLLDPNPETRITTSELMETSWFRTEMPRNYAKELIIEGDEDGQAAAEETPEMPKENLNAFHLISLSEGLDLSPLFCDQIMVEEDFSSANSQRPLSVVISRLGQAAKCRAVLVCKKVANKVV